jgi:hypothetical protein
MGVDTPIEQLEIGWACGRSQGRLGLCHDTCRYTYRGVANGIRPHNRKNKKGFRSMGVDTPIEQLEIGWACGRSQGRLGLCHDTCRYTYRGVANGIRPHNPKNKKDFRSMGVDTPIEQLEIGWACGRSHERLGALPRCV